MIPFSSSIFLSNNNIKLKIKNYKDFKNLKPLSISLKKGFGFIKVDIYFNFSLHTPYFKYLNIFHEGLT